MKHCNKHADDENAVSSLRNIRVFGDVHNQRQNSSDQHLGEKKKKIQVDVSERVSEKTCARVKVG